MKGTFVERPKKKKREDDDEISQNKKKKNKQRLVRSWFGEIIGRLILRKCIYFFVKNHLNYVYKLFFKYRHFWLFFSCIYRAAAIAAAAVVAPPVIQAPQIPAAPPGK